jgi:hypothetical protein
MTDRRRVKTLITAWAIGIIVVLIAGYGGFRAKDIFFGPQLSVISPASGITTDESPIKVHGTAKNISFLSLNGKKIFADESGAWSEKVLLAKGYNRVTIKADDRFGRTVSKTLELIYK